MSSMSRALSSSQRCVCSTGRIMGRPHHDLHPTIDSLLLITFGYLPSKPTKYEKCATWTINSISSSNHELSRSIQSILCSTGTRLPLKTSTSNCFSPRCSREDFSFLVNNRMSRTKGEGECTEPLGATAAPPQQNVARQMRGSGKPTNRAQRIE